MIPPSTDTPNEASFFRRRSFSSGIIQLKSDRKQTSVLRAQMHADSTGSMKMLEPNYFCEPGECTLADRSIPHGVSLCMLSHRLSLSLAQVERRSLARHSLQRVALRASCLQTSCPPETSQCMLFGSRAKAAQQHFNEKTALDVIDHSQDVGHRNSTGPDSGAGDGVRIRMGAR